MMNQAILPIKPQWTAPVWPIGNITVGSAGFEPATSAV